MHRYVRAKCHSITPRITLPHKSSMIFVWIGNGDFIEKVSEREKTTTNECSVHVKVQKTRLLWIRWNHALDKYHRWVSYLVLPSPHNTNDRTYYVPKQTHTLWARARELRPERKREIEIYWHTKRLGTLRKARRK